MERCCQQQYHSGPGIKPFRGGSSYMHIYHQMLLSSLAPYHYPHEFRTRIPWLSIDAKRILEVSASCAGSLGTEDINGGHRNHDAMSTTCRAHAPGTRGDSGSWRTWQHVVSGVHWLPWSSRPPQASSAGWLQSFPMQAAPASCSSSPDAASCSYGSMHFWTEAVPGTVACPGLGHLSWHP